MSDDTHSEDTTGRAILARLVGKYPTPDAPVCPTCGAVARHDSGRWVLEHNEARHWTAVPPAVTATPTPPRPVAAPSNWYDSDDDD